MGAPGDLVAAVEKGGADAVAMGHVLHWGRATLDQIRNAADSAGIPVSRH
jgi:imidazole glycerol phosphate synthase subunit HisF